MTRLHPTSRGNGVKLMLMKTKKLFLEILYGEWKDRRPIRPRSYERSRLSYRIKRLFSNTTEPMDWRDIEEMVWDSNESEFNDIKCPDCGHTLKIQKNEHGVKICCDVCRCRSESHHR